MSAEVFRTIVSLPTSRKKINYQTEILLIGSCFTENIGEKLSWYKFPSRINPFGIVYNPLSVFKSLGDIIQGKEYTPGDLHFYNDQYFSFDHHSRFSNPDQTICLDQINLEIRNAANAFRETRFLIITFGSAFCYRYKKTNQIVANCHKLPDRDFEKTRLQIEDIVSAFQDIYPLIREVNPELEILLTVSPIRHWRDGAHENQLGKSVLLLAADALKDKYSQIQYFPAYELMMDELRDYRFYEGDMIHPNQTAVDFIWRRFVQTYMEAGTEKLMEELGKIRTAAQHRPFNKQGEVFLKFVYQQIDKITQIQVKNPQLDFTKELNYFNDLLR